MGKPWALSRFSIHEVMVVSDNVDAVVVKDFLGMPNQPTEQQLPCWPWFNFSSLISGNWVIVGLSKLLMRVT
jgi:hypothetical protein